jgi:hypothetical protein
MAVRELQPLQPGWLPGTRRRRLPSSTVTGGRVAFRSASHPEKLGPPAAEAKTRGGELDARHRRSCFQYPASTGSITRRAFGTPDRHARMLELHRMASQECLSPNLVPSRRSGLRGGAERVARGQPHGANSVTRIRYHSAPIPLAGAISCQLREVPAISISRRCAAAIVAKGFIASRTRIRVFVTVEPRHIELSDAVLRTAPLPTGSPQEYRSRFTSESKSGGARPKLLAAVWNDCADLGRDFLLRCPPRAWSTSDRRDEAANGRDRMDVRVRRRNLPHPTIGGSAIFDIKPSAGACQSTRPKISWPLAARSQHSTIQSRLMVGWALGFLGRRP